jgi:hypothetical protein
MQPRSYTRRLAPCVLAACILALAAGCEKREQQPKPKVLDPQVHGVLDNINALARETKAEREFRYDVSPDCTLIAQRLVAGRPGQQRNVPLGTTSLVRFQYAPGLGYGLRAPIEGTSAMESIFDARTIGQIEAMEAMLQSLETTCLQVASRTGSDPRFAHRR